MTDLLDQLDQRAHRIGRGDPRAIYRAAVADADAPLAVAALDPPTGASGRRPGHVGLVALVAGLVVLAVGIAVATATREPAQPVADAFPAADVRFGLPQPPDGYELSTVRARMYGPPPDVRFTTSVYAPDEAATTSLTVVVIRGVPFTPDGIVPDNAPSEIIGGHEVRIADDDIQRSGAAVAGWDRRDGSRVVLAGRGLTADDLRRAIPDLVIDEHDLATVAVVPAGFERRFAGDGTGSLGALTGSTAILLHYSPTDGAERQVSVKSVPGATFDPLALRWRDPSVEAIVLPDGSTGFRASQGRSWVKVFPEGLAVVTTYQVGSEVDVAALVTGLRSLTPGEWPEILGDAEVIEGLRSSGPEIEAVGTSPDPGWRTDPAP